MSRAATIALLALLATGCVTPARSTLASDALREQLAALEASGAADKCRQRRPDAGTPPHPFTSDGCSLWPDSRWAGCCLDHDVDYWCGGSAGERSRADARLRECASAALAGMGPLMWTGVRLGGPPWVPAPWRWGYGWDYSAGYTEE